VLAGCAVPTTGTAVAAAGVDPAVPGVRIVQAPDVVSASAAADVSGILADLQDFWRGRLGSRFTAPKGGYALIDTADTTDTAAAMCATTGSLSGNAYYCPVQDGIVIDAAALVPVVNDHYGVGGLAASLAHEFGHAIQARIGPTSDQQVADPRRYPQILVEAQADCAAGAFLQWAVDGHPKRLRLQAGLLMSAVSPLLDFRDPPTATSTDSLAHGLGLDRLRFILIGMRDGADECHRMTLADLRLTLGKAGTHQQDSPRFPDQAATTAAATASVETWNPPLPSGAPVRGDELAAAAADLAAAQPYGQFAEAAATVFAIGRARYPGSTGAACFVGAWTATVFGTAPAGGLGSWPGDADEAMDLIRARPGATFADLTGYADGFDHGLTVCS
jgi:predicted metalloprotease